MNPPDDLRNEKAIELPPGFGDDAMSRFLADGRPADAQITSLILENNSLRAALEQILDMPNQSIWEDDRDDAASSMVGIAAAALRKRNAPTQ